MNKLEPISLFEENGKLLMDMYQKNKSKEWKEWLVVKEIFENPGKQGLVGILESKEDPKVRFVFKISQYINYLVQHESCIMEGMNDIASYCINFPFCAGYINADIDPTKRKKGNPFSIDCKYPIEKEVLLMQHLEDSKKLYNYIKSNKIQDATVFSCIKQVLIAMCVARKEKKFVHYDLHSNNVMVKKCDKDLVLLYVNSPDVQFCVPTFGNYSVIIDYGFSYSLDMDNKPLWCSLNHTDVGFMSDRYDPIADPKLFLISVSKELKENRDSKSTKKLRNIAKNNYGCLDIELNSGWDSDCKVSAGELVVNTLVPYMKKSKTFANSEFYFLDIIQTLITLPLKKQDYSGLKSASKAFIEEFYKIENKIASEFYSLYVLKGIVNSAKIVSGDYKKKETRKMALSFFKKSILEYIDSISKYCLPKNVHYEKMLCSLLCLAKCLEGLFYKNVRDRMKTKEKSYEKIPITDLEELCVAIDVNIPSEYVFNEKTKVMVMDSVKKQCNMLNLTPEEISLVNSQKPSSRGSYLYEVYSK